GPRQAAAVFQRVEREALVMQQRAMGLATDQISLLQLALAQHPAVQAEELLELALACHHLADAVGTVRQLEPAFRAAIHIQILGAEDPLNGADRLASLLEHALRRIQAEAADPIPEIVLADADGAEAAIAPAAAPSDAVSFQHMGGDAVLSAEMIGG